VEIAATREPSLGEASFMPFWCQILEQLRGLVVLPGMLLVLIDVFVDVSVFIFVSIFVSVFVSVFVFVSIFVSVFVGSSLLLSVYLSALLNKGQKLRCRVGTGCAGQRQQPDPF
jgi:hypothetical protein